MKILLVGLGSIGQKHLSILKNIKGVEVAALRTSKGFLQKNTEVLEFCHLRDALLFCPDGVIISNPTALHIDSALPFLQAGIKVLIEKPIDISLEKAKVLLPYKHLIRVAYCMRFHPIMKFLKNVFEHDIPFKIGFKRSFFLPKWHPYADYSKEYTAQKSLGGGVIRTLSHEIDLAIYWFGPPSSVSGVTDRISFLNIDTDDYAFFSMKTSSNARVNFELDFFSPININIGEAFTSKGMYRWNLDEVSFMSYDSTTHEILTKLENPIQDMYENQMNDFCLFINGVEGVNCTFDESVLVLNVIEKVDV